MDAPEEPVGVTPPGRGPGRRSALDHQAQVEGQCGRCGLWEHATQAVPGEGPVRAQVMLVGEQPGDQEDRAGRPFVGPAGRLLRDVLREIDAPPVYLTNSVRHFKWKARGPKRLHQRPRRDEVEACRPWLDQELEVVRPRLLVLLGATAAQGLLGPSFRVSKDRGVPLDSDAAPHVVATVHPSSILRAGEDRAEARRAFADDLRSALALLEPAA